MRRSDKWSMDQPELSRLARYRLLRPYLRQNLLEELLVAIPLEEEEMSAARGQFLQDNELADQDDLDAFCRYHLLSDADLDYLIAYPVRVWKYCQQHFAAQAESRFLVRKQSLDQVVYSLLRTRDPGLARELCLQVREGEATFSDLAATYSEGPERVTRGIVGPVPMSQGHPDLVDRLGTAEPGVVLDPFQIESWWVLVRLESYVPAVYDPDAADAMTQELLDQWLEEQVDRRLQELTTHAPAQPIWVDSSP